MVKNAADPEQVERAASKERRNADKRQTLVATQLSTYQGREYVWSEIEACGVFDLPVGSNDEMRQFLGKRERGIVTMRECMTQHPDAFLVMQGEALARLRRDDLE